MIETLSIIVLSRSLVNVKSNLKEADDINIQLVDHNVNNVRC